MDTTTYFSEPTPIQKRYEALKIFYTEKHSAQKVANEFGYSEAYFKKLRFEFAQSLKNDRDPFFKSKKHGPKSRFTHDKIIAEIVALRKQNHSILDIKVILEAKEITIALDTIDKILKSEGFAALMRRTQQERQLVQIPKKIAAPMCKALEIRDEEFSTERGAAPLIFLPLIEELGIINAIKVAGYPETSVISATSSVLSFLALKLLGNERLSHEARWNLDRALGFFAGLNVLPKKSTLSSYSYRVSRGTNKKLLSALSEIFKSSDEEGEFNLDFKTIPHWGDASVLENNWSGMNRRAIKSLLALIVQNPATGNLSYTDAEIKHRDQSGAVLDFVDFWKEGRGESPKMLIFDSKFTTYENLNKLNKDDIKFLTLRRRGQKLCEQVSAIEKDQWQNIRIDGEKRKNKNMRVYDGFCDLGKYEGKVRQIILTGHGRMHPTFLITNDLRTKVKDLVKKYARRWLVEQEIAEQIAFFHLNQPSSSIVVKVDFDLTLSLLAHNLYRKLTDKLIGFEKCTVPTIYRNILENGANIKITNNEVIVRLKKKTHLPILFQLPWLQKKTYLSWMGLNIKFEAGTTS